MLRSAEVAGPIDMMRRARPASPLNAAYAVDGVVARCVLRARRGREVNAIVADWRAMQTDADFDLQAHLDDLREPLTAVVVAAEEQAADSPAHCAA